MLQQASLWPWLAGIVDILAVGYGEVLGTVEEVFKRRVEGICEREDNGSRRLPEKRREYVPGCGWEMLAGAG
jgi:hypothetical protein